MHTVEMLDQAIALAKRLGYAIRQDSFAGCGGGGCELKGRKFLFLDLDLNPEEQTRSGAIGVAAPPRRANASHIARVERIAQGA